MLKLKFKNEPYWLDLGMGVRVKVKPCTSSVFYEAKAYMNSKVADMAKRIKDDCNKLKENAQHIIELEKVLLRKLKESNLDFICNTNVNHIPGNISLSFKGISGETLMHRLDLKGIMVSTGSACDSVKNQTSHVIKALGVPEDYAYGTIRISLGKENKEDEIEEIFIAINEIVKSLTA